MKLQSIPYFSTDYNPVNHFDKPRNLSILRHTLKQKRTNYKKFKKQHNKKYHRTLQNRITDTLSTPDLLVNLSNKTLTEPQIRVLNRGLKFIPTPKPDTVHTAVNSFLQFKRRMLLQYHFRFDQNKTIPVFRVKSEWDPPEYSYPPLQKYFRHVLTDITNLYKHPTPNTNNMSTEDIEALQQLQNHKDIVIKPADKGDKIVIWPTDQYIQEAQRQLSDKKYYQLQNKDHTISTAYEISTFLTYLNKNYYIDDDLFEFLQPHNPSRTPIFYMLPKIHKPSNPGRPIISGCDSPPANLSIYLDHYLEPIVQSLPSYIKDTDDFLQTILHPDLNIPPGSILVTMDVQSLYTNIPQDEGTDICLSAMKKFYGNNLPLPISYLRQMFDFILKYNFFKFDNQFYLQIHGTAMGTAFAPNYSGVFLGNFENTALCNAPNNLQPIIWKRFIDDIFIVWTHGEAALQNFHTYLNNLHPTVKLDITYSTKEINFLDTTIYFNSHHKLESTLYVKPTDICALLHADSFHPSNCKRSVIYSQALRFWRIITEDNLLNKQLSTLRENLLGRGYDIRDINNEFQKITNFTQRDILYRNICNRHTYNVLSFIMTFDHTNKLIGPILKKHWGNHPR